MWIATAAECREMDRQSAEMGVSVETLMHNAGRAVAANVLGRFPDAKRIAVVCGKGNNGGDGMVAARLLAERALDVEVFVAAEKSELNENAARECERLKEVGIEPKFGPPTAVPEGEIVLDALLGTGSKDAPRDAIKDWIDEIEISGKPVVSVDVPSGIVCDDGSAPGAHVSADLTVILGVPKPFLFQGVGVKAAGRWMVDTIGLPAAILDAPRQSCLFSDLEAAQTMPVRRLAANKGSEGKVVIVAGSDRMPGAAVLAVYAALRAGAGLVTIASTNSVCRTVSTHIPEAILFPLPQKNGFVTSAGEPDITALLEKADSAVIGPGLGTEPGVGQFLSNFVKSAEIPIVMDADALNLASAGQVPIPRRVVCTPHPGEAARLLYRDTDSIQQDRFAAVRELARRFDVVMLLKGASTLVAEEHRPLSVNPTGNPGMASPGMGDVLSGIIGALLAKGLLLYDAARLGAYWHGLAADLCAQEIGPAGYLASEVADYLPKARATITST